MKQVTEYSNENMFLLHSYLALCQPGGLSQLSTHGNRKYICGTTKGGHFMVHLTDHVTVFLCTIQVIIY